MALSTSISSNLTLQPAMYMSWLSSETPLDHLCLKSNMLYESDAGCNACDTLIYSMTIQSSLTLLAATIILYAHRYHMKLQVVVWN